MGFDVSSAMRSEVPPLSGRQRLGAQNGTSSVSESPVRVSIREIRRSPENDQLYRPIDPDDPEVQALARSIAEHGILEPLVITADGYLVSGHRRYAAARIAHLRTVPCSIRADLSRETDPDGFVAALREYNRQRVKSLDEVIREEVVSADPESAYLALLEEREQRAEVCLGPIRLRYGKPRSGLSAARQPFLRAVRKVLRDLRRFLPVSERQIHYNLLNDPPLIHAGKPGSRYRNDPKSYKALSDLCTRARISGHIPEDWICDETRPVTQWQVYDNSAAFVRHHLDRFLKGYHRNLMRSQPNHIEIVVEKNTVASIVEPVAARYGITMTSGRGYSSLPPRIHMRDRFRASGKEKLILLVVSDFDPEGEDIAHSFARSMNVDFEVNVHAIKAALTLEQTADLPESLAEPKEGSSRRARFVQTYGADQKVYELEALPPARLQQIVEDAIESVIDRELLNAEIEREKHDAVHLQARRKAALDALRL